MAVIGYVEWRGGEFRKSAYEVVSEAKRLAKELGTDAVAVLIGKGVREKAAEFAAYGADRILVADSEQFEYFVPDVYVRLLQQAVEQTGARFVLLAHTTLGRDLAPRLAARLSAPDVSDIISMNWQSDHLEVLRPVYAGKVRVTVAIGKEPAVVTLRPKMFEADNTLSGAGNVEDIKAEIDWGKVLYKVAELKKTAAGKMDLTEADIIVSGGRGMKGPENFKILEELAELLGGVVGASRAAVDADWRPHSDQVGQTGKTVSPTLYIACGISGAIQHLAGMSSSKYIVAINKDPEAPIFQVANYGIVGDLFEVVPALTEALRKELGK